MIKEKELKLIIDDLENEKNNLSFFNTLIVICELIGNSVTNMHNGVIDFTSKTCNYKYTNKLIDILLYLIHAFVNQIAEDYDKTILPSLPPKQYIFDICSELKYKIKDTDLTEIDLLYKYCNE